MAWDQLLGGPLELCEDPHRCRQVEALLDRADQDRRRLLAGWLLPAARGLALSRCGCRVVQTALEVAQAPERRMLLSELCPHAVQLYESPHGNYVVTKLIEIFPPPALEPLVRTLEEKGIPSVARHQYGCRVLERLVEHCPEPLIKSLLDQVVDNSEALSLHPYGNFVIQHLLEHGSADRRRLVLRQLLPAAPRLAVHRTASHVVQRVLDFCEVEGLAVVDSLLSAQSPNSLVEVACSRYGCHVVRQLSELRDPGRRKLVQDSLSAQLQLLEAEQFGRRSAEAFGLVAPLPEVPLGAAALEAASS